LTAHATIGLLRAEAVDASVPLKVLLARCAHLILGHEGQKGRSADLTRLEKMASMLLFQPLQRHLSRHSAAVAQAALKGISEPFGLKLLLARITGAHAGIVALGIFFMLAVGHSADD